MGFDFGMGGYLVLIVMVWFFSGGGWWWQIFFFFLGNFCGDKLRFLPEFWWEGGCVGFLERERERERDDGVVYIILMCCI